MNAGREDRIDKAGGIANQQRARRPEAGVAVRIIFADAVLPVWPLSDSRGGAEKILHHDRGIDEVPHGRFRAFLQSFYMLARYYRSHAGQLAAQRDVPAPAFAEGFRQNVSRIRWWQPLAIFEITIKSNILKEPGIDALADNFGKSSCIS